MIWTVFEGIDVSAVDAKLRVIILRSTLNFRQRQGRMLRRDAPDARADGEGHLDPVIDGIGNDKIAFRMVEAFKIIDDVATRRKLLGLVQGIGGMEAATSPQPPSLAPPRSTDEDR